MISKMTKYTFVLLNSDSGKFLEDISGLGLVDIVRSAKPVDDTSSSMLAEAEKLKKAISTLESLEDAPVEGGSDFKADDVFECVAKIGVETLAVAELEKQIADVSKWGGFDLARIEALAAQGCKIRFYEIPAKRFSEAWGREVALEVISRTKDKVRFVTVSDSEDYSFPEEPCAAPEVTVAELEAKKAEALAITEELKQQLLLMKSLLPSIKERYEALMLDLDRYLAASTGETAAEDQLCVYTGFAPASEDAAIMAAVDAMPVYCIQEKAVNEDHPPIALKNNKFTGMFTVLTDMYGRPEYNGFDPTPYISVFFLLFFAFCMGDAGYGIALTLAGLAMGRSAATKAFAPLVTTLGVATIVIGFLFHTFFSVDISGWKMFEPIKDVFLPAKMAGYDGTMVLALIVGVVHICLALVVKTIYATKNNGFLGSLGVWGWTLLIVGGIAVGAFSLAGVLDAALTKWIVIVLGGLSALGIFLLNDLHRNPLVNIGAGLWETYNTATGLLGDVLSYLRLYALGLAGAMLGYAFNDLGMQILGDGAIVNWVFCILVVVIGHTLNLAMCALGAFVHPLRLNFLEFFKNSGYEGNGRIYSPLKSKNNINK